MVDKQSGEVVSSGREGTYLWATAETIDSFTQKYRICYYTMNDPHNINYSAPDYYEVVQLENVSHFYFWGWKGYAVTSLENTNPNFNINDETFSEVMANSGLWSRFY
jgi:hypothetical protein